MKGYIQNVNFLEMENMKYWAPPASWSVDKKKTTINERIFSGEWLGARKVDGAFYKLLKDSEGNVFLLGRSKGVGGEFLDKHEWLPQLEPLYKSIPNGTCVLGEIYLPNNEGSKNTTTIMGCLKEKAIERQKKNPAHYYIFDILAYDGEIFIDVPAISRFTVYLVDFFKKHIDNKPVSKFTERAIYFHGDALWEQLQMLLADGYEGMVITYADAVYEPGKRPSKTTAKVKQEIKETIDVVIIGYNPPTKTYTGKNVTEWEYWVDLKTEEKLPKGKHYKEYAEGGCLEPVTMNYYYGWAGSLKIGLYEDGELRHYGDLSGLTQEILSEPTAYIDMVAEVGGMQFDNVSRRIRHPKFLGWRMDKEPHDCTFSQVK